MAPGFSCLGWAWGNSHIRGSRRFRPKDLSRSRHPPPRACPAGSSRQTRTSHSTQAFGGTLGRREMVSPRHDDDVALQGATELHGAGAHDAPVLRLYHKARACGNGKTGRQHHHHCETNDTFRELHWEILLSGLGLVRLTAATAAVQCRERATLSSRGFYRQKRDFLQFLSGKISAGSN